MSNLDDAVVAVDVVNPEILTELQASASPELRTVMPSLVEELQKRLLAEQAIQVRAEGEMKGRAKSLLQVIEVRGLAVDEHLRERIAQASVE